MMHLLPRLHGTVDSLRSLRRQLRLPLALAFFVWTCVGANAGLPAVKALTGVPISPSAADGYYNGAGGTTHTNKLCALASVMCGLPRATAIRELARTLSRNGALSSDQFATNVYEYVYKNIDTEFRYGLSKGAFGALLDQSGTSFDQAHLMVELLKEGAADFPAVYSSLAPTYLAGTVTMSGTSFSAWTGITGAQAACQLLANGAIPFSLGGTTPTNCSSVSGNVTSVTLSQIWVQATTSAGVKLYDPSYKTLIQKTAISLASAMVCGTDASPTCGSVTETAAIPSGSTYQGYDATAQANYVQSVQYPALGSTLNGFAQNLQHYIETNSAAASLTDIVGGHVIDPSSMPAPGASLPYDSAPTVQHSWAGDVPDQYRSRLRVQFDAIDVWLYADETYGYWLHLDGAYSLTNQHIHYATLFFEREKGTAIAATPNLTYVFGDPYASTSTNELVPLVNSTVTRGSPNQASLTLSADHPYAPNSGTFGDDSVTSKVDPGPIVGGASYYSTPVYILQSWGHTGPGSLARAGRMAGDKHSMKYVYGYRAGGGTAIPYSEYLLYNVSIPGIMENWLGQAGAMINIGDGMAQTRTVEHHMLGAIVAAGIYVIDDAVGSISTTSKTANASNQEAAFNTAVAAYDAFEGYSLEQALINPNGANSIRWFLLTNAQSGGNRFYEATPSNVSSVLFASTNYGGGNAFYGPPSQVVQNYLTASGPTFNMIVPKNAKTTSAILYGPLLAYATDNSQIAYLISTGQKGSESAASGPDPMATEMKTVNDTKPTKPLDFAIDPASGGLTLTPRPDIVTGTGAFPNSLSYQRYYSSGSADAPVCNIPVNPIYAPGLYSCADTQRLGQGWTDNLQIGANFSSDALRALGSDSALDASNAIAAVFALQNLNQAPGFKERVTTVFIAGWMEDQFSFNSIVLRKPPATETYLVLPDGRYNPRPGSKNRIRQTGSVIIGPGYPLGSVPSNLTETDGDGALLQLSHAAGTQITDILAYVPTTWTFPNGQVVTFNYSAGTPGALTSVSNSFGNVINLGGGTVDDGNGHSAQIVPTGSTTSAAWSSATGMTVTLPDGGQTIFTFDHIDVSSGLESSRLSKVYLPLDHTNPYLTFDYDGLRRAKDVVDGNGKITTYFAASIGASENVARGEIVDALNGATTLYADHNGHVLSSTDPLGRTTLHLYDGWGRETRTTFPESNHDDFVYDVRSNRLSVTHYPKVGSPEDLAHKTLVEQIAYMEGPGVVTCVNVLTCNLPSYQTDPRGHVTQYCWESTSGVMLGLASGLTAPASCPLSGLSGPQTDYTYQTLAGVRLPATKKAYIARTPSLVTMTTAYQFNGSNHYVLQSATVDSGTGTFNYTTSFAFDAIGNLTATSGPRTDVTYDNHYVWDVDRRLTMAITADPDGAGSHPRLATKRVYDLDGRVTETDTGTTTATDGTAFTLALAVVDSYDAAGNTIKETTPTRITQYSFDADERPLCTAIRMNADPVTGAFGTEPADACTLSASTVYGPDRIGKTVYDADGETLQVLRAFGTPLVQTYATNTYSPNGKLTSVYDADGATHITTYSFDGFDRPIKTLFADGTHEDLTYDVSGVLCAGSGEPCTKTNRSGQTFTYSYDALDEVTTKLVPAGEVTAANTVTTQYDLLGHPTSVGDTNGNTIANVYDAVGRLSSSTRTTPGLSAKTVSYLYDAANNRTKLTWPDGYYATYGYDALNHPSTVVDSGSTTLATYGYDNLGRRATLRYNGTTGAQMLYSWSAEDDLLTLSSDFAGTTNDVSFTNTFTPAHQWATATVSNAAFKLSPLVMNGTYAANALNEFTTINGSTIYNDSRGNLHGVAMANFGYDPENRMVAAGVASASYAFDPNGRRTQKAVSGTITNFVHDGDTEIAEYDGSGTLLRRYVPGPAIDDYVAMVTAAGVKTFFHTDKMGSVIAMSDTSGNLAEGPYTYDSYGNCRAGAAACSAGVPFRYTGQRLDPEISGYYYRARVYNPVIGRFYQTDPVGYDDDLNAYTYVGNDPTDDTDPSGEQAVIPCPPPAFGCPVLLPPPVETVTVDGQRHQWAPDPDLSAIPLVGAFFDRTTYVNMGSAVHCVFAGCTGRDRQNLQNTRGAQILKSEAGLPQDAQPNEQDLKKVPNKDANKVAQDAGYDDAHDAKDGRGGSSVNIYKDRESGKYWLWDGTNGTNKEPL